MGAVSGAEYSEVKTDATINVVLVVVYLVGLDRKLGLLRTTCIPLATIGRSSAARYPDLLAGLGAVWLRGKMRTCPVAART